MSELLASLWTPELQMALMVCVVILVILYVLSIIWVIRDAYRRGDVWIVWGIVALVPYLGALAYCLMRKPMLKIDQDEQELEIALKQRELMKYGECANCGYPVESDYLLCPQCHTRLKNMCPNCHRACEPQWSVCPYCATQIGNIQMRRRQPQGQVSNRQAQAQAQRQQQGQARQTVTQRQPQPRQ